MNSERSIKIPLLIADDAEKVVMFRSGYDHNFNCADVLQKYPVINSVDHDIIDNDTAENTRLYLGSKQVGGLISFDLHPITQHDDSPIATLVVYLEEGFGR